MARFKERPAMIAGQATGTCTTKKPRGRRLKGDGHSGSGPEPMFANVRGFQLAGQNYARSVMAAAGREPGRGEVE